MSIQRINDALVRIASLKSHISNLNTEKSDLEKVIIEWSEQSGGTKAGVFVQGREVHGTVVKGTKVITDYEALLAKCDPAQRKAILTEVVDPTKVEAAVALGIIDAQMVADVSEEKPIKPYVKISGDPIAPGWEPPARRRAMPKKR